MVKIRCVIFYIWFFVDTIDSIHCFFFCLMNQNFKNTISVCDLFVFFFMKIEKKKMYSTSSHSFFCGAQNKLFWKMFSCFVLSIQWKSIASNVLDPMTFVLWTKSRLLCSAEESKSYKFETWRVSEWWKNFPFLDELSL